MFIPGDIVVRLVGSGKGEKGFIYTVEEVNFDWDGVRLVGYVGTYNLDGTSSERYKGDYSRIVRVTDMRKDAQE